MVAALVAVLTLIPKKQSIKEKAAPATTLSISPGSQNIALGAPFSFTVQMNTGVNQITVFDLAINYDQNIFQIDNVTPGSSVPSDFSPSGNTHANGEIFYSSFTTDVTKALSGSGLTILNVSGTVKPDAAAGTYNFTFGSDTVMKGLDETQNVLTGTTPGVVVVTFPPVNGDWSAWNPVSCPTACGLPASSQTRTCDNPAPAYGGAQCSGPSTQSCATPACVCVSPLTDSQTLACLVRYSGSIIQTRTKGAYPDCTWGNWTTTSNTCIKNGDVNHDGSVNALDLGEIIQNYRAHGNPGWIRSDLNSDGAINALDIGTVIQNYRF